MALNYKGTTYIGKFSWYIWRIYELFIYSILIHTKLRSIDFTNPFIRNYQIRDATVCVWLVVWTFPQSCTDIFDPCLCLDLVRPQLLRLRMLNIRNEKHSFQFPFPSIGVQYSVLSFNFSQRWPSHALLSYPQTFFHFNIQKKIKPAIDSHKSLPNLRLYQFYEPPNVWSKSPIFGGHSKTMVIINSAARNYY